MTSQAAASLYASPQMQTPFQHRQQQPHQTQHQQASLAQHSQAQQIHQPPMAPRISQAQNPNSYLTANKTPLQQQPNQVPQRRQRTSIPQGTVNQLDGKRVKRMSPTIAAPIMHQGTHQPKQQLRPHNQQLMNSPQAIAGPSSAMLSQELPRKPVRSAVEEARLRAQREAESFASSRRDPAKREASIAGSNMGSHSDGSGKDGYGERRASKRARPENDRSNEAQGSRRATSRGSPSDDKTKQEDDSETEKQERYKRRLDMNRESAAVSRVRRRAYVKELEERLAAVEAEKLQLEGKLEIMMSQNDSFKKQLDNLFLMVTNGGRPSYPPPPPQQGDGPQ